jgi:starch phosphorylase
MNERPGTPFSLEIAPRLPAAIARLDDLANNLWFSWDRPTRALFARLDAQLWDALGHNPRALLKNIDQKRLEEAARDPVYLQAFDRTLANFDAYRSRLPDPQRRPRQGRPGGVLLRRVRLPREPADLLGRPRDPRRGPLQDGERHGAALRGHGAALSPGLLPPGARQRGRAARQLLRQRFRRPADQGVNGPDGKPLEVTVEFGEHDVLCKVWQAQVGRITLYLLDTDHEKNRPEHRATAHRLYGGDRNTRIQQEIVLGMGGVRALAALGLKPTVWHINEGHAAFLVLERLRGLMRDGVERDTALEAVASNTIFTTHTAVGAGHDHFTPEKMERYFIATPGTWGCRASSSWHSAARPRRRTST